MDPSKAPESREDSSSAFIRQSYERGHLDPIFPRPTKECADCHKKFVSKWNSCLACRKAKYAGSSRPPAVYDSYLDDCGKCSKRTLHLGPGWCVHCYAVNGCAEIEIICEECERVFPVPTAVKDDKGGEVDMYKVDRLWCEKCGGLADSWVRPNENE